MSKKVKTILAAIFFVLFVPVAVITVPTLMSTKTVSALGDINILPGTYGCSGCSK